MLTVEKKALEAARKTSGAFLVKTISVSCGWVGVSDIAVELCSESGLPGKNYNVFDYEGIKVYIEKFIKLEEDIRIYQKANLPFVGRIFKIDGANAKCV